MSAQIALALGGGGVRGGAHIGVLRVLEREGIRIATIAGTSIGGMVAALYLAGGNLDEMEDAAAGFDPKRLFRHGRGERRNSMLGLKGLTEYLHEALGEKRFEDLPAPLAMTAADLLTGQEVVLRSGKLVDAVLATIAFPGIFPTRPYGEWELVDGAVTNPVPVALARSLAPPQPTASVPVVGVPLSGKPSPQRRISGSTDFAGMSFLKPLARLRWVQALRVFNRSFAITRRQLDYVRMEIEKPELLVYPQVGGIGIVDRSDAHELARRGEQAMQEAMPQLRALLGS